MSRFVRIIGMEIFNFKNVTHGEIRFPNYQPVEYKGIIQKSDISGIYGQNGSGKTAVVEAFDILKSVLSGKPIPFAGYNGIIYDNTCLQVSFFVEENGKHYKVIYKTNLNVCHGLIAVLKESLTFYIRGASWKSESHIEFDNPFYLDDVLSEDVHANVVKTGKGFEECAFLDNPDKLAVSCASKGLSFFFNSSLLNSLNETNNPSDFRGVVSTISDYSKRSLFVIKVGQLAQINSRELLPLNVSDCVSGYAIYGCIPLFLNGTGLIAKDVYEKLPFIIESVNIALEAIIPDLNLEFDVMGEELSKEGVTFVKINMYSIRGGHRFSTKYESEGIKRIISLLSCLVSVYNSEGFSLVVDELDSGIFEYLLGELLYAFEKEAKGQLIFTSHNLRAFEKLSNESIICSTVNPNDRYIRLIGLNQNNNKRDYYIRALALGGQKESLYDGDELDNIGYAFRKAGKRTGTDNG